MEDMRDAMLVGRNSAGKRVLRPTSPHVQVYRWKITMAQSILHRATGIALGVGAVVLVAWLFAAASAPSVFAPVQAAIASPLGLLVLFGFTVSLFYHLAAGLRHLAWDTGWGFAIASVFVWVIGFFLV